MGKEMIGELELNRIYQRDCIEGMRLLLDKSIDMILCDLPYGTTRNKWDSVIPFEPLWEQYERIIKDNGAIVLFAQTPFDKVLACSNLKLLRYEWIWEKTQPTGHLNAKKMPMKSHENILVFYKKLPTYNPQKTTGHERKVSLAAHKNNCSKSTNYGEYQNTSYDSTERYPRSVLVFPTDKQKSQLHPTQKPVDLLRYLIRTYTNEGEVVLDNCMGSGSTAVSAIKENRKFVGFEIEESYIRISEERISLEYKEGGAA